MSGVYPEVNRGEGCGPHCGSKDGVSRHCGHCHLQTSHGNADRTPSGEWVAR